jgi:hypothetical protein
MLLHRGELAATILIVVTGVINRLAKIGVLTGTVAIRRNVGCS